MMRIALLIGVFGLCTPAHAQNWALLNPAYRYNYSNDGTDTISNQIRVMHVDTLGVDSFRYELNRIAKRCETCPGVQLMLNHPQFMHGAVVMGSSAWCFRDPGSFVLFPQASVGESWLADTLENTLATVLVMDTATVFGMEVPRRTIGLSSGDSIVIGDQFGVLRWGEYDLIGLDGPDVGALIPSLGQVYPFQAGDVVEYIHGDACFDPVIGPYGSGELYKFTVETSTPLDDRILYDGQRVSRAYWYHTPAMPWSPFPYYHFSGNPSFSTTWTAGREELPMAELVNTYPGQLIRTVLPDGLWYMDTLACVAKHGTDSSGRYVFSCESIPNELPDPGWFGSYFLIDAEAMISTDTIDWFPYNENYGELPDVQFANGIGLDRFSLGVFKCGASYELVGAVIGGDTIGTVHSEEFIIALSVPEIGASAGFSPNPASDVIRLTNAKTGSRIAVVDLQGRIVLQQRITSPNESIDMQALPPGVYMIEMEGIGPQRFIIAR